MRRKAYVVIGVSMNGPAIETYTGLLMALSMSGAVGMHTRSILERMKPGHSILSVEAFLMDDRTIIDFAKELQS